MKKTLFTIHVRKSDGTFLQQNVLAQASNTKPAIVAAIETALAAAGEGAAVQSVNTLGTVDSEAAGA